MAYIWYVAGLLLADRVEVRLLPGNPGVEVTLADNLAARIGHVTVPQAAELGAPHLKTPGFLRRHVKDVVHARVGIRLDAQLVCPERVDDVERRDVQLDG